MVLRYTCTVVLMDACTAYRILAICSRLYKMDIYVYNGLREYLCGYLFIYLVIYLFIYLLFTFRLFMILRDKPPEQLMDI